MNPSDQARQVGVVDSWLGQTIAFGSGATAPAETLLAETGALAAGFYDVFFMVANRLAQGDNALHVLWRNAANSSNIWCQILALENNHNISFTLRNVKIAANERFQWYSVAGLTSLYHVSIIATRRA